MSGTMKNLMLLSGTSFAWMFLVTEDSGNVEGLIPIYKFDNVQSAKILMAVAGDAATASGEKISISRGDAGEIQFPKEALVIDGTDESEIASSTGGADASGKGTAELVINEAAIGFSSMTKFLGDLKANKDSKFLIVIPTGYTHSRTGTGATRKSDGYAYAFVKLSSDIDLSLGNSPVPITMTFTLQKHTTFAGDLTSGASPTAFEGNGILVKRGGNNIAATLNVPLVLETEEQDLLELGEWVLKETAAA